MPHAKLSTVSTTRSIAMSITTKRLRYLSLALLTLCVATFLVLHLFSPIVPFAATGGPKSLWLWN
jgi:hypothetical protein